MRSALTIAGSDPTGGAGLQADLKVFRSFGVYGYSVPSALTAQNTLGVEAVEQVGAGFFLAQLDCLLADVRPDAMKTGLLYSARLIEALALAIGRHGLTNLVIDPVTVSSTGVSLMEPGALEALKGALLPLSRVITPNIQEAAALTGIAVEDERGMEAAARALRGMGPEIVIVTGGHLREQAIDLLWDGASVERLSGVKAAGEYHGTGCAFSAAVAAGLALGVSPREAARGAKDFMARAIEGSHAPGRGMRILHL